MDNINKEQGLSLNEDQRMLERVFSQLEKYDNPRLIVKRDFPFTIDDRHFRFDLYLPNGCPPLGYFGKTVIELKSRLGADTLYHYYTIFSTVLINKDIQTFILIYSDKNDFSTSLLKRFSKYRSEGFYVLSLSAFCKREEKKIKLQPRQEPPCPIFELSDEEKKQRLIEDAHIAFIKGHNTLFLGAGLSCSVNVPKWEVFLSELLDKNPGCVCGVDYPAINKSCDHSFIITGRYIENCFSLKTDWFKKEMHNVLYKHNPIPNSALFNELVEMICFTNRNGFFSVDQAITFNYDDLLETALSNKRPSHSIFDRTIYTENRFPIYHVHGMIPQNRPIDSTPVLSEQDYHQLYKESFHWSNVIQLYALSRSTSFFIGLSMNDPNLRRLLDISRNGSGLNNRNIESMEPKHFAIMERKLLDDTNPNSAKNSEHIRHTEEMMYQLGINIIWYENLDGGHQEVPKILKQIRSGYFK